MCKDKQYDPLLDKGGADRVNGISFYLKQKFGKKMIKLSIDAGFTCPNRDGSVSTGGCTFCNESAGNKFSSKLISPEEIASSIDEQIELYSRKWPDAGYIAYFQTHTNTYAPVEELRRLYYAALEDPRIEGIAIATRPDCLPDDVLDLLSEINKKHFMWVELGLQTSREDTAKEINRCYTLSVYDNASKQLAERNIKFVTHIILGLPGETEEDMRASVLHACENGSWGIKLHMLNIVKGSKMAEDTKGYVPFKSIDQYAKTVCDILEYIPPEVVIHRLTADSPRKDLISPSWSYKKRSILNAIHRELRRRGTRQGSKTK